MINLNNPKTLDEAIEIIKEINPEYEETNTRTAETMVLCAVKYEELVDKHTIDTVRVIRCKDCCYFEPPHILHSDGTKTYVDDDLPQVTADIGIGCQGKCLNPFISHCLNHEREDPDDFEDIIQFRYRNDFCSRAERKKNEGT